jgi:hypothetical protein
MKIFISSYKSCHETLQRNSSIIIISSLTDMELYDDMADGGGLESHQLSDDDIGSDDDDDDDDDDDIDAPDIAHVRMSCFIFFFKIIKLYFRDRLILKNHWLECYQIHMKEKQLKNFSQTLKRMPLVIDYEI